MNARNSLINASLILTASMAIFFLGWAIGYRDAKGRLKATETAYKTDTLIVRDTVRIIPDTFSVVSYKFVPFEVDCFRVATDTVYVPILQKVYESPDYKAWVSGFDASLDSISVYPTTKIVTVTKKQRRWGVGLQGGYGYTTASGFSPYIGVGVYYRIF